VTRKTIEEAELERRLRLLINLRMAYVYLVNKGAITTSQDELKWEVMHAKLHRQAAGYLDRTVASSVDGGAIRPARRSLATAILRRKFVLSNALDRQYVEVNDGDVFEDVETGKCVVARVHYEPLKNAENAFWDDEEQVFVSTPPLPS
jgi:hypothetical protein